MSASRCHLDVILITSLTAHRTTGATVLRLSHGYEALPHHDPFIELADEAVKIFGLSTNVAGFLVNFIPARTC